MLKTDFGSILKIIFAMAFKILHFLGVFVEKTDNQTYDFDIFLISKI